MATTRIWSTCEAIVANTAETIDLGYTLALLVTNKSGADLYIKFEWAAGDTEVSATNFDACISNSGTMSLTADTPGLPRLYNMRVISTGSGRVAAMGW